MYFTSGASGWVCGSEVVFAREEGVIKFQEQTQVFYSCINNTELLHHVAYLLVFGTNTWLKRADHDIIRDQNAQVL